MFLLLCPSMPDHHLTTTVQWCCKMSKKPVVATNNGLFLVLEATVQNQQILRFNDSLYRLVVVLRRQVPGGFESLRAHLKRGCCTRKKSKCNSLLC